MSVDEARRHALIKFGGVQHMKEHTRDEFRMMWFEDWFREIRYSVRALRRATWFTAISSLMLALGIGAATAVFSVINSVLLQPLPYPRADSLVTLQHVAPGANLTDVPMASTQFYTYRKENKTFEQLGLWQKGVSSVTGTTQPEEVQSLQVTAGTLQTLGVAPWSAAGSREEDDTPGTPETVMLAHGYWQRRFGGDRSIVGRTLTIDARPAAGHRGHARSLPVPQRRHRRHPAVPFRSRAV